MTKRYIAICLAVVAVMGLLFVAAPSARAAEGDTSIYKMLDALPMKNIPYSYMDDGTTRNASVYFSSALLLQDARGLSGELAKASVALAMAAYNRSHVNSLLSAMGFSAYSNSSVYNRGDNLTLWDNDYVAYTIAYQDVTNPVTNEKFRIYCVPIRGTPQNAEWFSDFNLGTGTEHEGFKKASTEVYNKLKGYFDADRADGFDADHRVVWLTGHSRGAACANLISGWLSRSGETYTKAQHVFGYTFACPGVSLKADTSMANIYNFNNMGDLIPMLPMQEWGYKRYGRSIALDSSYTQYANVKRQFKNTTGKDYAGEKTRSNYQTLLVNVLGTDRDVYYDSGVLKSFLAITGWALGGKNDANIVEVIGMHLGDGVEAFMEIKGLKDTMKIRVAWTLLTETYDGNDALAVWANKAHNDTREMTEAEFQAYLKANAKQVSKLQKASGISIANAQSFSAANEALRKDNKTVRSVLECIESVMELLTDENGNVGDKINHAHTAPIYTVWINSQFCGYRGWYGNKAVTSLDLTGDYISIGNECFQDCTKLSDVTIPDSVVIVGASAFKGSSSLTNLPIPQSVTRICEYAFAGCTGINTMTLGKGVTGMTVAPYAFSDCTGLTSVIIGNGVTEIGGHAFQNCTGLGSVSFGYGITSIAEYLFQNCTSLNSVTIRTSVTSIGNYAFRNCTGMTKITIPTSVTSIGYAAFSGCSSLESMTIPFASSMRSFTEMDENIYPFGYFFGTSSYTGGVATTQYYIESFDDGYYMDMYALGKKTYYIPSSLKSVTITHSLIHLAFNGCQLNSLTISDRIGYGSGAFSDCSVDKLIIANGTRTITHAMVPYSVKEVIIPSSVTSIGNYAFDDCKGLTSITIPNSVRSIGDYAFDDCPDLTEVTISDNVTLGKYAFRNCPIEKLIISEGSQKLTANMIICANTLKEIVIPASVTAIDSGIFKSCSNLTGIRVAADNPNYSSDEFGVLFNKNKSELIWAPAALQSYTIPNSVTTIGDYAFTSCTKLTGLSIPNSVNTIGRYAFSNCDGLTSITVPAKNIGDYAFHDCDGLTKVVLPYRVSSVGVNAFSSCDNLTKLAIQTKAVAIGNAAFYNCTKLAEINLFGSITSVGDSAFAGCNSLSNVYYTGTKEQWEAISIGKNNAAFTGANIYYEYPCVMGHTEEVLPAVDATCTKTGLTYGRKCTTCNRILLAQQVVPKKPHTPEIIPGKPATCTETGLTDGEKCAVCKKLLVAQKTIPMHFFDNDYDVACNNCDYVRNVNCSFNFENYRVVLSDKNNTHANFRVVIYKLGDKTVADPTDEEALKAIDTNAVTKWGIGGINEILITDAGNYVLLLKYNVGTGAAIKVPLQISISADPKLIIDKNNKITGIDNNSVNINHRVVVYYLGDKTVGDIYDEAALKAIDAEPETVWKLKYINRLTLTRGGNYVLHLCYNVGTSAKRTVAQRFTVESIPTLSVNQNNVLVAADGNAENQNHRLTVFYLGNKTVNDPYDETAVSNAAASAKTYWDLPDINKVEITEGGNYIIHLYYNVGTSAKRTLAIEATLTERPKLSVSEDNKLVVTYSDTSITNPRAYIYNVGDADVDDIYDEAALKKIATPTQVWGLSSILKKQLSPGTYVIHLHYNVDTGAKSTVALKITI